MCYDHQSVTLSLSSVIQLRDEGGDIKIQKGSMCVRVICVVCMFHTFLFEITLAAVAETGRRSLRFKGKGQPLRK